MRTAVWCLVFFILGIFPLTFVKAQSPIQVSGDYTQQNIQQILSDLELRYPLAFFYRSEWLPETPRSISFNRISPSQVLNQLLSPTQLSFEAYDAQSFVVAPKTLLSDNPEQSVVSEAAEPRLELPQIIIGDSIDIQSSATLTGTILSAQSLEPIYAAQLEIPSLKTGAVSQADGRYRIEIPVGNYLVQVRATGYDSLLANLRIYGDGQWNVQLETEAYRLDEVVLEAEAADRNVGSVNMGVSEIKVDFMKRMPAFLGEVDVLKSVLLLPGVSTVGEGSSGFNVRGGNIDQNLILQDGAPILNASHVLGFFSLFHSDAIRNVKLYKGHIPAQYGGRLASVLDVELKDGNFQQFKMKGGLGIVSSRLVIEGPLIKDKTSLLIAGRTSYSDWILKRVKNLDIRQSSASFWDANAKITHRLNSNHTLSVSTYGSHDFFRYSQKYGYSWNTRLINIKSNHVLANNISGTFEAIRSDYQSSFFDPEGADAFDLSTGIHYDRLKEQLLFSPRPRHEIRTGIVWTAYQPRPEELGAYHSGSIYKPGSDVIPETISKGRGTELAFFVNDEITLNPQLALSVGLRYSVWTNTGPDTIYAYDEHISRSPSGITGSTFYPKGRIIQDYKGFEPRISMRIFLDENSSLKLSYNRTRQYLHLISNTTASTPVDLWQISNRYVPPQIADNFSVGYFRNFQVNRWETSLEFYYKQIGQLLEYKDLPKLLLNEYLETELLIGKGRAYGGELSVKKNAGKMTGWFSYTYSRSLRQVAGRFPEEIVNNGEWFPSPFDKPHTLNLVVQYKINKKNTLAANFTYSTGRPITIPVADYFIGTSYVPHYSLRNQFRIPDYHRLDLSYTFEPFAIRRQRYQDSFTFSVYNFYFRKNAFSVFFTPDNRNIPRAYLLAVLGTAFPSLTYNFGF